MLISKNGGNNIADKIKELEEKYSIILSEDYKKFLLKYNGGETPKTKFSGSSIKTDIRKFYGFVDNENSNIFSIMIDGLAEELLNNLKLVIATNAFGDYFTINISEERKGEISFVYHDMPEKEKVIASNFGEFLLMCKSEKIGHIRTIEERKQSLIDAGKGDKITQVKIDSWQKEIDKYAGIHQEEVIIND